MAPRLRYELYLFAVCLLASFAAKAQFSEADLQQQADALFEQKQYAQAMPLYSQLLSLNPTKPEFNFKYGATALYGDADKKEEAIKFLRFATTNGGINPLVWYFLGRAYHLNYQFADAIQAYQKYGELASKKEANERNIDRAIEDCRNGQNLLSNIKEVTVRDKKKSTQAEFFRIYDLSDIGGKILVTPEELLSSLDKKNGHKSLIHFRGTGTTVYFSSYGKDGKTGLDIYRAEVLPNGTFSNPEKLSNTINTDFDEDYPFLHPDNKTFYFASKGHSSMGGYDIFKSEFNASANGFSKPENLDFAINTPDDDLFYIADSAKSTANFASARNSRQGELHVYKVDVQSVPIDLTFVKGTYYNRLEAGNKLAKITVIDASSNKQIDQQYTDPNTGDYVLSFPRSGKYKFLVEAEKSSKIHAGLVTIPKSTGVMAFLQEMELVSSAGVEKLLINNLFDKQFDGDLSALVQNLLRQKAALDVNFNSQPEKEPGPEPELETNDVALAYNAAGFGAGMSNDKVLETSRERSQELEQSLRSTQALKAAAQNAYFQKLAEANSKVLAAESLLAKATAAKGSERSKLMFEAGVQKKNAKQELRDASNTAELSERLSSTENDIASKLSRSLAQSDSLGTALSSGNFDIALIALKREKNIQENSNKVSDRVDVLTDFQMAGIEAGKEAKKYLDRSSAMRIQSEDAQRSLVTKRRQLEIAKGKDAKELQEEVARLELEFQDLKSSADRAFRQAEEVEGASFDKRRQYEILAELKDHLSNAEASNLPAADNKIIEKGDLADMSKKVEALNIDVKAVGEYLKQNPDATRSFNSDQEAMAFKKEYAVDDTFVMEDREFMETADSGELESEEDTEPGSVEAENFKTSVDDVTKTTDTNDSNSATQEENELAFDTQAESEIEMGVNTRTETEIDTPDEVASNETLNSEKVQIEPSAPNDAGAEAEEKIDITENSENSLQADNGQEAALKDTEAEINATSKNIESDNLSNPEKEIETAQNEIIRKRGTDTKSVQKETLLSADLSKVEQSSQSPQSKAGIEKRIEAEKVKISASNDWIAIIDASISELKQGIGGSEDTSDEDVAEQLKQYEKLKKQKQDEIATSESLVSGWRTDMRSDKTNASLQRAAADLDTLSSSHIARLEQKIPSVASELNFIKDIRAVDRDYLPSLASIELSGLSAPEIAGKRLDLNERFVTSLDQLLGGEGMADVTDEKLLELRRIKTLEIRQDKEIQTGEMVYEPRTPEALEYTTLIKDSETVANPGVDESELSDMSPKFQEDLKQDFKRDVVFKGYEVRLDEIEANDSGVMLYAERIRLKERYLSNLQAEIQMYAAALKSNDAAKNQPLVDRYNMLLSERSQVIDEIDGDRELLTQDIESDEKMEGIEIASNNSITNEKFNVQEGQISNDVDENSSSTKVLTTDQSFDQQSISSDIPDIEIIDFDAIFVRRSTEIKQMQMSDPDESKAMAAMNAELAAEIDTRIGELTAEMDRAKSDQGRDLIQVEIQRLDAIAADKRQESDRLSNEADILASSQTLDQPMEQEISMEKADEGELPVLITDEQESQKVASLPDELKTASLTPTFELEEFKYKSLNANVALNEAKPLAGAIAKLKKEMEDLAVIYESSKSQAEADSILSTLEKKKAEYITLDKRLKDEISTSNTAEIQFYSSSNDALFNDLKQSPNYSKETVARLNSSSKEVKSDLEFNDGQFEKGEISREDKLKRERTLIASLSEINLQLEKTLTEITPELVAGETVSVEERKELGSVEDSMEPVRVEDSMEPVTVEDSEQSTNESETELPFTGDVVYFTSDRQRVYNEMDVMDKDNLKENAISSGLSADMFGAMDSDDEFVFLQGTSQLNADELAKLKVSPNKYGYLLASAKADTLKSLENTSANNATAKDASAIEKENEIARLQSALTREAIPKNQTFLQEKIQRLNAAMKTDQQQAAVLAYQAESFRNERKNQETIIAKSAAGLRKSELAELNSIVRTAPYVIITSDLASSEPSKKVKVSSEQITSKNNSASEIPKPEIASDMSAPEKPSDYVAVNENVDSIDEEILLKSSGNWLGVIEIIAEKTDFSDVKESMFVSAENSVYNKNRPIPLDPAMPAGLIFQVQVGAFRNAIPQDLFGEFAPVMGQKLDNGVVRYRAGLFKQYRKALEARNKIRDKGYSDAFVVAYVDGERLTGVQAQQIVEQSRNLENISSEEMAAFTKRPESPSETAVSMTVKQDGATKPEANARADYYNDPDAAEAKQVEVLTGLFYTVQVGVYSKPVKLAKLYDLIELNSELTPSGYIRYTTGRYASVKDAAKRKSSSIAKGVSDAFITAYYNGKRIALSEAEKILAEEGKSALSPEIPNSVTKNIASEDKVIATKFVVIMGSFSGDIPQNVANVFLERDDLKIRRVGGANGESIYVSNEFDSRTEAEAFLQSSRAAGVSTAVIGEVKNGKISSVSAE